MRRQVSGLLRDAWWFIPLVFISGVVLGVLIRPLLGLIAVLSSIGVIVYFAMMRYDEHGNERTKDV